MDRSRKRGPRSNRLRRSIEDMRDAVTSTPAGEPMGLRYNEYLADTSDTSESSDTSDYTYDPDDSEGYYEYTHGDVENAHEEQSKVKQTTERGVNSQEESGDSRDNSESVNKSLVSSSCSYHATTSLSMKNA